MSRTATRKETCALGEEELVCLFWFDLNLDN
jgi:hypothetical protein